MDPAKQAKQAHKQKYRQTNAKHWCEFCRIFIQPNEPSRRRHESSSQHQEAVRRHVGRIQKEEKEKSRLLGEFAQRAGHVFEETAKVNEDSKKDMGFYGAEKKVGVPVPLLSVKPPVPRSYALRADKPLGAAPVKDTTATSTVSITADKEKFMAQKAIVGQWEEVIDQPQGEPIDAHIDDEPSVHSTKIVTSFTKEEIREEYVPEEKIAPNDIKETTSVEFIKRSAPAARRNIRR